PAPETAIVSPSVIRITVPGRSSVTQEPRISRRPGSELVSHAVAIRRRTGISVRVRIGLRSGLRCELPTCAGAGIGPAFRGSAVGAAQRCEGTTRGRGEVHWPEIGRVLAGDRTLAAN